MQHGPKGPRVPDPRLTSLPADMARQSGRRVGYAAGVFAAFWVMALVVRNLLTTSYPGAQGLEAWPMPGSLFAGAGLLLSVTLAALSRRFEHQPERILALGLGFQVVTAALVAFPSQWVPFVSPTRISWVCIVILVYPAVAPDTPGRTLIGGLAAATMDPLAVWAASLRGAEVTTDALALISMFLPNYLCAAVSVVPAHIIRHLAHQVREARELGGYRLGAVLGKGGMGQVYRAEHRLLARPAAIKVIRPDVLGTGLTRHVALERFKREATAAAVLRSPHTIDLYDFGVSSDGTFYYVMELLDGISFEDLVTRFGPLPAGRAVFLMEQACDSLAEAHARNIIHRDIKPSNLLANRMGLIVDFVKVLDFGLVKFNTGGAERPATLTSPDVATGTPAFMAPEVALGERSADHRLDIYSLGCVLYWLLTGQLVFDDENAVKVMHRHISEDPVPPSRRSELPIPPELDAIVLACLAKRPAERPATASELAERLAAVPIADPWNAERARRWWERHLPQSLRTSTPQTLGTLVPQDSTE